MLSNLALNLDKSYPRKLPRQKGLVKKQTKFIENTDKQGTMCNLAAALTPINQPDKHTHDETHAH